MIVHSQWAKPHLPSVPPIASLEPVGSAEWEGFDEKLSAMAETAANEQKAHLASAPERPPFNQLENLKGAIKKIEARLESIALWERKIVANPAMIIPPDYTQRVMEDKIHQQSKLRELRQVMAFQFPSEQSKLLARSGTDLSDKPSEEIVLSTGAQAVPEVAAGEPVQELAGQTMATRAPSGANSSNGRDTVAAERAALLRAYKDKGKERGIQITDQMIAKAANPGRWTERTPVQRWKRNYKCTPGDDVRIRSVLKDEPHLK